MEQPLRKTQIFPHILLENSQNFNLFQLFQQMNNFKLFYLTNFFSLLSLFLHIIMCTEVNATAFIFVVVSVIFNFLEICSRI